MVGSGRASMSDSWTREKPSMEDPSKSMPSSKAVSSSAGVMANDFRNPSTSVNQRRMKRMPRSSTVRSTYSSCFAIGSLDLPGCHGKAPGAVRASSEPGRIPGGWAGSMLGSAFDKAVGMISILSSDRSGLASLSKPEPGCWINVVAPTADEIAELRVLGIPADYLAYPLDPDERARSEREDGDLLIILRIPHFQGEGSDIPYATIPLGIILTPDYLVTVVRVDNELVEEMASGRVRGLETAKRVRFVLRVLLQTSSRYLSHLRQMTRAIDALEDELQESTRNREVLELLKYQKSLTFFTTALRVERADDGAAAAEPVVRRLPGRRGPARGRHHREPPGHRDDQHHQQHPQQHDGCLRLDHLQQPEQGDEAAGFDHHRRQPADHGRQLLRHERRSCPSRVTSGPSWSILGISLLISLVSVFVFWRRDWL